MKTLQKTAARFEVKALDEGARTFTGLASTWDKDLGNDIIEPGAFKRTLARWKQSGRVMPLIDQHNYGSVRSVIGKMLDARETDAGLEADFQVIEGPDGEEIMRRVKGGYIDSLSIGYEAVQWEMEQEEGKPAWDAIRHLKEVRLHEVSVVIWPMNPAATIDPTSVKSIAEALRGASAEEKKQIRALLEDAPPAPANEPPADPQTKGPAPEEQPMNEQEQDTLALRIKLLNLRRPAEGSNARRPARST